VSLHVKLRLQYQTLCCQDKNLEMRSADTNLKLHYVTGYFNGECMGLLSLSE